MRELAPVKQRRTGTGITQPTTRCFAELCISQTIHRIFSGIPKVLFLWFVAANMYYGVVLISTELLNSSSDTCGADSGAAWAGAPNGTSRAAFNEEEVECSLHKCRFR